VSRIYTIGELAAAAGVPVSTLRYYERIGILQPASRTEGGYRQYGAGELERVRLVRLAQSIGLTLDDAGLLLRLRDRAPVPPERVDELVRTRLAQVEQQLAQLTEIKRVMEAALQRSTAGCDCSKCADLELLQAGIFDAGQRSA
jgi:DNA-binding transcriptional MerR regulator